MRRRGLKKICAITISLIMCMISMPVIVYASDYDVEQSSIVQEELKNDTVEEEKDESTITSEDELESSDKTDDSVNKKTGEGFPETEDFNTIIEAPTEEDVLLQDIQMPKVTESEIEEGIYYISNINAERQVLDVSCGTRNNGGNVQIYSTNLSNAQKWKITYDIDGYATITNVNSGKVLDVSAGILKNAQNVQQYDSNNSRAQKWIISKAHSGYVISSALSEAYNPIVTAVIPEENEECSSTSSNEATIQEDIAKDFVLDCAGGRSDNGANIQIYTFNNSKAQEFVFTKSNPEPTTGTKLIENGVYRIQSNLAQGKSVDVSGGSTANGANVQIYANNNVQAQTFQFVYDENTSCYTILNVQTGLVLDADNANPLNGTNVHMWMKNGSNAQKWAAIANDDGSISFINRGTALALDLSGGCTGNGTNIQLYRANNTTAQKFSVCEMEVIADGVYSIFTYLNLSQTFDVPGASTVNGTQIKLYSGNATPAQKFVIHRVEPNTYTIASVASAKYLTDDSGRVVQQELNGNENQKWSFSFDGSGIVITNKGTGKVMDCWGGNSWNGTIIQTYTANGSTAQRFRFNSTLPVNNGTYEISSAISLGKRIDVSGGNRSNGANIQLWNSNGTNSQKFQFTSLGNSIYRITDVRDGRAIDVCNGSSVDGANVQLWNSNNSNAQKWRVSITDDGWYTFINVASGKSLDVFGAGNYNGANIQSYTNNSSIAQKWHLIPTTKKIEDTVLERAQNLSNSKWSATGNLIMVDLSAHRVMVFRGNQGNWSNIQNWWCANGAAGSPTVVGEFTVGSRGYSFGSGYTCYYYTQFCGNYLFHSVLYRQGTFDILDGRLGMALSHGCVRLDINCAKWIYDNIPSGTKVVTYY